MKKQYLIYIYILLTNIFFFSCKTYLTQSPKDALYSSTIFNSEEALDLYINGFYVNMLPVAEDIYRGDVTTDITVPSTISDYLLGNITQYNTSGWDWGNLRNINYH
ncbi:MAG: hypothetical protein QM610_13190 [Chitinophagaceae bacterium]